MQNHGVGVTTTAATATPLAAPQAGWRWRIVGLHISVSGACVVTAGFSATNQRVYQLAANQTVDIGVMDWEGDAASAFTVQSSAAVTVNSTVDAVPEVFQ